MKNRSLRALVVGAGLGGRTVAAFLRQSGYHVTVTSPRTVEPDGAVFLAGNAVRVLSALGKEDLFADAVRLTKDTTFDRHGRAVSEHDYTSDAAKGHGPISCRRSSLLLALKSAAGVVDERLGVTISRVSSDATGAQVVDEEGERSYDFVVVADGVRSTARASLFPDATDAATPWSLAKFDATAADDAAAARVIGDGVTLAHVPLGGGRRGVSIVLASRAGELDLAAIARAAGPAAAALFDGVVKETLSVEPVSNALASLWTSESSVLIGGAAHALHPLFGQGPAMVIEDARALQISLDRATSVAAGLAAFEAMRRPRVTAVHALSWEIAVAASKPTGLAASFRGALHKVVPSLSPEAKLHARLASVTELGALLAHRPDLQPLTPEARDVLRFLVKIGQVDGLFDAVERAFVASSMAETGHFATPAEVAEIENETLVRRTAEIVRPFKDRPLAFREHLLETGVWLAAASGRVAGDEHKALREAGHELGIGRDVIDALIQKAVEARA